VIGGLLPLQRPDLFGAVLYDVGVPDEVRSGALDPTAARNMAEIGDLDTAAGVQSLLTASPYHRTPKEIAFPALLIHSATDDYNFGTQMLVGKWVARLQATNTGTRPVVWVRATGGHRWLWSISPEWAAQFAAFMFWQLGDSRYQPARIEAAPVPQSE
jgi:prolyl oligopeptidase PreP (S9A serine peptidase family)